MQKSMTITAKPKTFSYYPIFCVAKIVNEGRNKFIWLCECRYFRIFAKIVQNEGRNKFIWLCRVPPIFRIFAKIVK